MNRFEKRRQKKIGQKAKKRENRLGHLTLNIDQRAIWVKNKLKTALQHHGAGEFLEAEQIYHEVLEYDPNQPMALHLLGVIAHQKGNNEIAVGLISKALSIEPPSPYLDYAEANNNLGAVLQRLERLNEAEKVYRKALAINPNYALALNNLGNTLRDLGNNKEAIESYRKALVLKPDFSESQHMLNALKGITSESPPQEYIKNLFNGNAANFDDFAHKLEYTIPLQIKEMLATHCVPGKKFQKAIDLGCGTGLAGKQLRDISSHLTGIDISDGMLAIAHKQKVYDKLILGEIEEVLDSLTDKYDLVISLDVLIYVGALPRFFGVIRNSCAKGALFIFTIESQTEGTYSLLKSGRYSHSEDYVLDSASGYFKLIKAKQINLRKENNNWINGKTLICQAL